MMGSAHSFFFLMPGWTGILLLIVVWTLFRSILLRSRPTRMEQTWTGRPIQPPPVQGQIKCPRCSTAAPGVASFCPHCGLAFNSLPPPIPQGQVGKRERRNVLPVLIWASICVVGCVAYIYWRASSYEKSPPAPERPHVRVHEYYRR